MHESLECFLEIGWSNFIRLLPHSLSIFTLSMISLRCITFLTSQDYELVENCGIGFLQHVLKLMKHTPGYHERDLIHVAHRVNHLNFQACTKSNNFITLKLII